MNEQQRARLFELWKRAPFPEIASAVDAFMQEAVTRASGGSEVAGDYLPGGGADGPHAVHRYCDACEPRG